MCSCPKWKEGTLPKLPNLAKPVCFIKRSHWRTLLEEFWINLIFIWNLACNGSLVGNGFCNDEKNNAECRLVSIRLLTFYFGGSKLARLLSKIEYFPKKLLYIANRRKAKSSKCGLSTTLFYDNDHLNLSKIEFHSFEKI